PCEYDSNSNKDKENKENTNQNISYEIRILEPTLSNNIQASSEQIINNNNSFNQNVQNSEKVKDDYDEFNPNTITEPELKFNSTFKKLSIDLNDDPTEFNINEICVNANEEEQETQP